MSNALFANLKCQSLQRQTHNIEIQNFKVCNIKFNIFKSQISKLASPNSIVANLKFQNVQCEIQSYRTLNRIFCNDTFKLSKLNKVYTVKFNMFQIPNFKFAMSN